MLFFGNLVDNLRGHQKQMIITLEVAFGIVNLLQAGIEYNYIITTDISEHKNEQVHWII